MKWDDDMNRDISIVYVSHSPLDGMANVYDVDRDAYHRIPIPMDKRDQIHLSFNAVLAALQHIRSISHYRRVVMATHYKRFTHFVYGREKPRKPSMKRLWYNIKRCIKHMKAEVQFRLIRRRVNYSFPRNRELDSIGRQSC